MSAQPVAERHVRGNRVTCPTPPDTRASTPRPPARGTRSGLLLGFCTGLGLFDSRPKGASWALVSSPDHPSPSRITDRRTPK